MVIEELEKRREQAKKEIKLLHRKLARKQLPPVEEAKVAVMRTEESPQQRLQATERLKQAKRELEVLYKDLMRVMFSEEGSEVAKDAIMPLERKINTLIMRINDQVEEIESSSLSKGSRLQEAINP